MLTPKEPVSGITRVVLEPEARQIFRNSETKRLHMARIPMRVLARAGPDFLLLLSLVFILGAVIVAGRGGTTRSFCLASVVWLGGPECPASNASPTGGNPEERSRRTRAAGICYPNKRHTSRPQASVRGEARSGRYCATARHWPGKRLSRTWEEGGGIAMPIRRELRPLYPPHWRELSSHVRFERAGGRTAESIFGFRPL
jgi:hypothetical protein